MYENDYLYAVERDGAYLAHYGVKGMKWGVRKAIERGNDRALGRQYRKAAKKLAKLEKRAASGKKYAKRAALLGAGAAGAGALAAFGTTRNINNAVRGVGGAMQKVGAGAKKLASDPMKVRNPYLANKLRAAGTALEAGGSAVKGSSTGIKSWNRSTSLARGARNAQIGLNGAGIVALGNKGKYATELGNMNRRLMKTNMPSNNAIARIGAGAVGAGLAGAAGYNAYRAATTKRAARKAAQFRSEMNKAFAGTRYANGNRQGGRRRKRR